MERTHFVFDQVSDIDRSAQHCAWWSEKSEYSCEFQAFLCKEGKFFFGGFKKVTRTLFIFLRKDENTNFCNLFYFFSALGLVIFYEHWLESFQIPSGFYQILSY